eukprot:35587_1
MTTSARKRRHMHDARLEYESPRKRLKRNHSNHNIRPNRSYRRQHNAELSQSQSEGEDNDSLHHDHHSLYPQRAQSQVVYHDAQEIEFEFRQCLALYSMIPRHKSTTNPPLITHTMSQVVSGKHGNRNNNHRSRNRHRTNRKFIKKSQNNPWDRKMIDFLSHIQCIMSITQDEHEHIRAQPTHWMNASLAINLCVKVYGDRVDNLRDRVHRLLSTISRTETKSNTKNNNTREHRKSITQRRKKKHYVSAHDVHKINCDMVQSDRSHKYILDRLNIMRQSSNLFLSSTQWWLDKHTPWICHDYDNGNSFCDMLANDVNIDLDVDFNSLSLMATDSSTFFHKDANTHAFDDADQDAETMYISLPNSNHMQSDDDILLNSNHNHNIESIPFPYMTPTIPRSTSPTSPLLEPIDRHTTPVPLINNRISTPPRSLRQIEEDKEEEKAEQESCSTFHTSTENEDSDSENMSRSQTFTLPKLRRLTRTCCDMSVMPNLLLDEECLDAFIIDRTPIQKAHKRKKKKRTKKRLRTNDSSDCDSSIQSPCKKRRICHSIDRVQMISHTPPPPLPELCVSTPTSMDNNVLNARRNYNKHSIANMVEFPRGCMQPDMLFEDDIAFESLAQGALTYVDEYSVAPSTPKTSVSVPLLTPSTVYSETVCDERNVLSGVMEMDDRNAMNCMDLNVVLGVRDGDTLHTLSPLQLEFESPAHQSNERIGFMQHVFNGSEVIALNKCTYDILCEHADDEEDVDQDMTFDRLLGMQHDTLGSRIPDVTVAMRFLSLLTVCSDSYHKEREYEMDVRLDRQNINRHGYDANDDMMTAMGDFAIRISKHSSSLD